MLGYKYAHYVYAWLTRACKGAELRGQLKAPLMQLNWQLIAFRLNDI